MTNRVYKRVELVGTSHKSIEDAINNAIAEANNDTHKACWFEVIETRGHVLDGKVDYYQVVVRIGLGDQ